MTVAAVVVAAGRGTRFGGLKQFALLDGETVAARSVRAARSVADYVVLVVPESYSGDGEGSDLVVVGGATRADSVRQGLARCTEAEFVLVHDAARPLASADLFRRVLDVVVAGADAAIPGLTPTDTVKGVTRDGDSTFVTSTLPRDEMVTVQTPQAFRREILERAHANAPDASDDAALVEALGARVVVVAGEARNIKITHDRDVDLLAELERARP
jgi:2-C-methyl-D-erythritol 4-phosphate cytidylyltransferase